MARETYFSPGTAPLEKFARGVYGALPKSFEEANQMFNPIELLREAGGKSGRFFESGGRDYQAGIGALIDTLTLGAGPASVGLASLFRTPIKKGTDFATDALQEAFNPLGASDDRVVDTGKKDMSRRDFLSGVTATAALSTVPLIKEGRFDFLKEIGRRPQMKEDFFPVPKSVTFLQKKLKGITDISNNINKLLKKEEQIIEKGRKQNPMDDDVFDQEVRDRVGRAGDDFFFDALDVQDQVSETTEVLHEQLNDFAKNVSYDDLKQLSDDDLESLNRIMHNREIDEAIPDDFNEEAEDIITQVLKERELYDPYVDMRSIHNINELPPPAKKAKKTVIMGMKEGGVVSLAPEARNMFNRSKGIESLIV